MDYSWTRIRDLIPQMVHISQCLSARPRIAQIRRHVVNVSGAAEHTESHNVEPEVVAPTHVIRHRDIAFFRSFQN